MFNYRDTSAVYALNSYLRKVLEVNLGMDAADYSGGSPLIPSAQQPEFMQTGKPFLVYGSAVHPATHLYDFITEAVTYTIYATSSTEANGIADLVARVFERQDEAAADVNDWIDLEGQPGNRPNGRRKVAFGSIRTVMVEKSEPADEEGGYVAALVMVEAKYVTENDTLVTTGFDYP